MLLPLDIYLGVILHHKTEHLAYRIIVKLPDSLCKSRFLFSNLSLCSGVGVLSLRQHFPTELSQYTGVDPFICKWFDDKEKVQQTYAKRGQHVLHQVEGQDWSCVSGAWTRRMSTVTLSASHLSFALLGALIPLTGWIYPLIRGFVS